MKINYDKFKELNMECLTPNGDQLTCFWIVQSGIERFLHGDTITEDHKNLLIDLGLLIPSEEETHFVKPHNFTTNG
jgi:hypothetical protein